MKKLLITTAVILVAALFYWLFKINEKIGYIVLSAFFILCSIGSAIAEENLEHSRVRDNAMWKIQTQGWCKAGKIFFAFAAVFLMPWTFDAVIYLLHL